MEKITYWKGVGLTLREKEVLNYIVVGLCTRQIAGLLDISENTVYNHRRKILKKKGARRCMELSMV